MGRWALFALVLPACAIDENGLVPPVTQDAGADTATQPDTGLPEAAVDSPPPPPQPCSTPPGACVASVPSGWSLLAFDSSGSAACPSNYTSTNVIANAKAQGGACDCSCTTTSAPSCDVGTLQRFISNDNSCSQTGNAFVVNGPGCNVLGQTGPLAAYSKSSPLAASGGTCVGNALPNTSAVTTDSPSACAPPTQCQEDVCNGKAPAGLAACIETAGAQSCPAGWGTSPVVVGDGFDLACAACSCDLSGTTCTNATITFYGNNNCGSSIATLAVDGTCSADPGSGQTPQSWKYSATTNTVCNATGPKTATVTLKNQKTICCKP